MYCHQCSTQNPDSANFCRVCGASLRQIQQPRTDYSPMACTGEPQQQYPSGQRLLRLLGTVFLCLGFAIFALFVIFMVLTGSVGSIELIVTLITSSIPISVGLLLRYLSRVGNSIPPSGENTAEFSERHGSKSLSPGASLATPVSSVTEATTDLLDAKK
jgi:hypothetical protein